MAGYHNCSQGAAYGYSHYATREDIKRLRARAIAEYGKERIEQGCVRYCLICRATWVYPAPPPRRL